MAESVITLGIGASPAGLAPFITSGLFSLITPSSTVQLTWTDNSGGGQTFNIERSITSAYAGFSEIASGEAGPTYDDTGLSDDTYWYRVRGYDGVEYSDYTNVVSITVTS